MDMTIDDCLKLAIKALAKFLDKGFNIERIDAAYVKTADEKMKKVDK